MEPFIYLPIPREIYEQVLDLFEQNGFERPDKLIVEKDLPAEKPRLRLVEKPGPEAA